MQEIESLKIILYGRLDLNLTHIFLIDSCLFSDPGAEVAGSGVDRWVAGSASNNTP